MSATRPPTVDTLKFSLSSYDISGDFISVLKTVAPLLYDVLTTDANAYRLAGLLNTNYNEGIINATNKMILNLWDLVKSMFSQGLQAPIGEVARTPTEFVKADTAPNNGLVSWMSNPAIQAMTLQTLKLPGTHDSPTNALRPVLSPIIGSSLNSLTYLSPGPHSPPSGGDFSIYVGQPLYDFILCQGVNCAARAQDTSITTQRPN